MRRRTLITPPIKWHMTALPVAPPALPVIAERGGTQLRTPKPAIVVDTREKNPFSFARFSAWFSGIEKRPLQIGDYSVAGMEDTCVVERKDLNDLVRSFHVERSVFVERLRQMSAVPDRLLVKVLDLMTALRKTTLMPAQRLEKRAPVFHNKGRIRVGADADITVFDAATVRDTATYEEPLQYSQGIQFVLVNGTLVVRDGKLIEGVFPGRAARAPISAAR